MAGDQAADGVMLATNASPGQGTPSGSIHACHWAAILSWRRLRCGGHTKRKPRLEHSRGKQSTAMTGPARMSPHVLQRTTFQGCKKLRRNCQQTM